MHSTTRTSLRIGTLAAVALGGLLITGAAAADDRDRAERINDHLDFFALVAAISGDHVLAYALDRRGDRIERHYTHRVTRGDRHGHRVRSHLRRHHRHSFDCGHRARLHIAHHDRSKHRSHAKRSHRRRHQRRHR